MTSAIVYAVISLRAINIRFMDPVLLMFTGFVPTAVSSNVVMTGHAHDNQALTVMQSTLGNFLRSFVTFLLIEIYLFNNAWYADVVPRVGAEGFGELCHRVFK